MIYCVEDEGAIRDLMIYTLRASGFEAQGFENSIGFWSAMKAQKPELIILDVMLRGRTDDPEKAACLPCDRGYSRNYGNSKGQ